MIARMQSRARACDIDYYELTDNEANATVLVFPSAGHQRTSGVVQDRAHVDFNVLKQKMKMSWSFECYRSSLMIPLIIMSLSLFPLA